MTSKSNESKIHFPNKDAAFFLKTREIINIIYLEKIIFFIKKNSGFNSNWKENNYFEYNHFEFVVTELILGT